MTAIYHNENDASCCGVLRRQFPDSIIDDRSIADVQPDELSAYRQCHFFAGIGGFSLGFRNAGVSADVNVWTGGFPCQDLSVAGKREGLAGSRSRLFFEFHRLISAVRPQYVVIENVPGLLSSNDGIDFAIVLGGLTGIIPQVPGSGWGNAGFARGPVYSVAYRVLDAQFFGVPQRRRRVFIVGSLGSGRAAQVLFESEGMFGNPPARRAQGQGIAADVAPSLAASGAGTSRTGTEWTEAEMLVYGGNNTAGPIDVATAVNAAPTRRYDFESETFIAAPIAGHHHRNDLDNETYVAFAWQQGVSENDRSYPVRAGDYAGSLSGSRVDAVASPTAGVRRLTPVECERLQGFPDGWTGDQSDSARYRQLGNAVAVPVAEWLGRRLFALHNLLKAT